MKLVKNSVYTTAKCVHNSKMCTLQQRTKQNQGSYLEPYNIVSKTVNGENLFQLGSY